MAESGLIPAQSLLEHRQARFTHRLYARPQGSGSPEEILTRKGTAVTTRLRAAAGIRRGETVEPQQWSTGQAFPEAIVIDEKDMALDTARSWSAPGDTIWTDGS